MANFEIDTTDKSLIDALQQNVPDGVSVKLKARFVESAGGGGGITGVIIEILNSPISQAFLLIFLQVALQSNRKERSQEDNHRPNGNRSY